MGLFNESALTNRRCNRHPRLQLRASLVGLSSLDVPEGFLRCPKQEFFFTLIWNAEEFSGSPIASDQIALDYTDWKGSVYHNTKELLVGV